MKKKNLAPVLYLGASLVLTVAALSGCGNSTALAASKQIVTIKGSDTMVHLTNAWAEAYMKKNPGASISVTGGGSGTGIAALINGTADICASSRPMTDDELAKAAAKGRNIKEHKPALDGIALVVNPKNSLNEITLDQLAKIFTGEVENWNGVGGHKEEIIVVSRESSSGTYQFFQEHVLKKQDYTNNALMLPATSGIVQTVSQDKAAIGYVGLGYVHEAGDKVKALGIKKDDASPAIAATVANVKDASYPIARALELYISDNAPEAAKDFVKFAESDEGQKIVEEQGFVRVQ